MAYFTILHILTLIILFVIYILLIVLTRKENRPKIFWSMIFANTLVMTMLMVFAMPVLDKYTKQARIENLTQKRILMTESITFSGQVRNTGSFSIGKCKLEVKLVNNPLTSGKLTGSQVFRPTSGFKYGPDEGEKSSTVVKDFVIASDLKPGELRNFSISMPYPPHFQRTTPFTTLKCR
jgi:hypothetical protein